jgi:hypothetical protein
MAFPIACDISLLPPFFADEANLAKLACDLATRPPASSESPPPLLLGDFLLVLAAWPLSETVEDARPGFSVLLPLAPFPGSLALPDRLALALLEAAAAAAIAEGAAAPDAPPAPAAPEAGVEEEFLTLHTHGMHHRRGRRAGGGSMRACRARDREDYSAPAESERGTGKDNHEGAR